MKIFDWSQWTSECRLAVATENNDAAEAARDAVVLEMIRVERAMNRWVSYSEISQINAAVREHGSVSCKVSDTLAFLVMQALYSYDFTGGVFDPRVEDSLQALGYSEGFEHLSIDVNAQGELVYNEATAESLHSQVHLDCIDDQWVLTTSVTLDLTAIGKACAADSAAVAAAEAARAPVLLSLGGDIATAGSYYAPSKKYSWGVAVQDLLEDPCAEIDLINDGAIATSSSQKRTWGEDGAWHHIIDPRTGLSAEPRLKTASVIAETALVANVLATAAIVWGDAAEAELKQRNCAARLVTAENQLVHHCWPVESERSAAQPELAEA